MHIYIYRERERNFWSPLATYFFNIYFKQQVNSVWFWTRTAWNHSVTANMSDLVSGRCSGEEVWETNHGCWPFPVPSRCAWIISTQAVVRRHGSDEAADGPTLSLVGLAQIVQELGSRARRPPSFCGKWSVCRGSFVLRAAASSHSIHSPQLCALISLVCAFDQAQSAA